MGTFEIKGLRVSSGGTPYTPGGNPPPSPGSEWITNDNDPNQSFMDALYNAIAALQAWCTGAGPSSFSAQLRLDSLGASIYLDSSSTPTSFQSLPAGFQALTAILLGDFTPSGGGVANFQLVHGDGSLGVLNTSTFSYTIIGGFPTILDLYADGFGVNVAISSGADNAESLIVYNLRITGIYGIQLFQWTLEDPGELVTPTTTNINITSRRIGALEPLDFTQISSYFYQYLDSSGDTQTISIPSGSISSSSSSSITFTIPNVNPGDEPPLITIIGVGNGTQFSGSIVLGQLLTIFFTSGSGIYKLVNGKTNDTLYLNGTNQVFDVKIPNPLAKMSLIP